jgi:hypothetical protein
VTNERAREIVHGATERAVRDARARRSTWVAFAVLLLCIAGAVAYFGLRFSAVNTHAQEQDQRITRLVDTGNDAAAQAQQLASQVRALGATPVVQPPAPAPAGPTIVTAAPIPGPGPTQAQIDAAVAAYLVAHPPAAGKSATPEMVATAVGEYLAAHPPEPGQPPTAQEIATAAANYLTAHSAEFQGPAGKNATDTQVAAAVDAYCSTHGSCAGKPGATGAKGDTVQGPRGPAGPTCPPGYELRDAVITAPDGSTYQGKACVDPSTSKPPGPIPLRK